MAEINEEIWKDVIGFEGYYTVSNKGQLKSRTGRLLKGGTCKTGHVRIDLCKHTEKTKTSLHRLVAEAFVEGKTEEKNVVDHIDRNPKNNIASNLRWVTHRENCYNQKKRNNKSGIKHVTKRKGKYIAQISRCIGSFETEEEAQNAINKYLEFDKYYQENKHLINQ